MNTIENAINATNTPTIPQITADLALFIFSASPWAVANRKAAKINMIMKKATVIGQRILNIKSMTVITLRPAEAFGMPPGSNAKMTAGNAIKADTRDVKAIFLFMVIYPGQIASCPVK